MATVLAFPLAAKSSEEGLLWFWFSKCSGPTMTLEVRLDKDIIYQSAIPLCHARRDSANSQGQEHRIHFTFRPRRSITWTGYRDQVDLTGAAQALEGDMWEAGADPDALLIGVTFADADKIYINTIHIAHPTQRDETEIARGLVVASYPARKTSDAKQ